jgi:[protein-PII] uridylyltransferase
MQQHLAERNAYLLAATPGSSAARELARMTDEAVRDLARTASPRLKDRWAIIALGGWGCGQLLPRSDLDLLVLSEAPASRLKPFVEAVLYPLWDAGLNVGHQVRSPKEQLRAMRADLATRTAALTGRTITGDTAWADAQMCAWVADVRKHSKRTLAELSERPRPGSPWLLEADLKNGPGGRRDYDELTWTTAILSGMPSRDPDALCELGLLSEDESRLLRQAADEVAAVRWRLQRDHGCDTLSSEAADDLASEAETAQDALGTTALILSRVRERLSAGRAKTDDVEGQQPLSPAEVFAHLEGDEVGLRRLELAAQGGQLEALLPGFKRLMSARRPGLGHELTVGAHCLRAAWLIGRAQDDSALARSRDVVGDLRAVRVAALVHDAGKLQRGAGHAERGADFALQAARAFGLSADETSAASRIVGLHLMLFETALREDLDDEDTLLRCAARIGDREILAPLHLLTAADSMATGPHSWTPWAASLVTSLVARLDAALSDDVDGVGLTARGERVRAETLATLDASMIAERAFVEAAPLRYLATRESDDVVRDIALVNSLLSSGGGQHVRTAVSPGPVEGTTSVTLAAVDRPFLLARIAGAFSLAGLDILSVDAYGTAGHVALDRFVVKSATGRALAPDMLASFDRRVNAALSDRYDLTARLAERRRHYPARASAEVQVRIEPAGWDTIVRVRAADRPGLLHDVASAVSASGLDIRWTRIHTVDGIADDTFHVTDGEGGGPVGDPGVLGHLSMRLRELD